MFAPKLVGSISNSSGELGESEFQAYRAEIHSDHQGGEDSNWQRGKDLLQRNEAIGLLEDDGKM